MLATIDSAEIERRRSSILRHAALFTAHGTLMSIESFLLSDGASGPLRCEPLGPMNNDGFHVRSPIPLGVLSSRFNTACPRRKRARAGVLEPLQRTAAAATRLMKSITNSVSTIVSHVTGSR
uniref:Uncharacterized protein n=1 Tax=Haptolina brevifila TaxID=156173 RepID=A0A7S2NNI6_9EUKA